MARPRGFCAGVVRAIDIVEQALDRYGAPVFVRHEIVHNKHVVETLRARGAIFVEELEEVPSGAVTVFSAHGVARRIEREAEARGLDVIDATCPLVRRVHNDGRRYAEKGFDLVLIGHEGHPEVEGTLGQIPGRVHVVATVEDVETLSVENPERVAYITQTTLSLDDTQDVIAALERRFPAIVGPGTRNVCYATQNRQRAVREIARRVDLVLVVGSANSSNSNRLREIGATYGAQSYLIDGPAALDVRWLDGVGSVGLTAGASAPECLVEATLARLAELRTLSVETLDGPEESVHFRLPERLLEPAIPGA